VRMHLLVGCNQLLSNVVNEQFVSGDNRTKISRLRRETVLILKRGRMDSSFPVTIVRKNHV
jgi:hypothetical protein